MIANYHTHTFRCGHAVGSDREYVEHAIKHGMKVLGFADHCPFIYGNGYVSNIRLAPDELDGYFHSLTSLKKEYDSDIKIYIGFEAEYIPELMEAQDKLLADYPLDYMILGQHSTAPEYISEYTGDPCSDERTFIRYVDLVIEGMNSGRYRYAAHPDLFNFTGSQDVYDREYMRLCEYLKTRGIPIEINLLGVRDGRHYTSERFLDIARKVGCKAMIGCDAHSPEVLSDSAPMEICKGLAEKFSLELVELLPGLD